MKSLSTALTALSLALAAGVASAAPVTITFQQNEADGYAADLFSGAATPFSDSHSFVLGGAATFSGQIHSLLVDAGVNATIPYLDIRSAYLTSASGQRVDLVETTGFDWAHGMSGVEIWTLNPTLLAAGQWTLIVSGVAGNDKGADGYDARLAENIAELPEPTALALVAAALAALGLSRRRRAN